MACPREMIKAKTFYVESVQIGMVEDDAKPTFLCSTEKCPILLQAEINIYEVCASEELHDHSGSNDRGNTELHKSTAIGSDDDTQPIQRVRRVRRHDPVKRDLGAHQED